MPNPILGMMGTGDFNANDFPKNWRSSIIRLKPNGGAALAAILIAMGIEGVDSPEYNWSEQGLPQMNLFAAAAAAAGVTTLTVDDGSGNNIAQRVRRGSMLLNKRTKEMMYVNTDPVSPYSKINVDRGRGTVAAAAINDNDEFLIVGSAHAEGASSPTPGFRGSDWYSNYTQIFRKSLSATRTAMHTKLRTESQIIKARIEANQEFFIEMERAYWFGQKAKWTDPETNEPIRTTEGIYHSILARSPSNIVDIGGALDIDTWEEHLRLAFKYGSDEKICFCGSKFLSVINKLGRIHSDIKLVPGDRTYGINLMEYVTPFGVLYLRHHPLFNEDTDHTKMGAILDMENIREREFLTTKYLDNIQDKGTDGRKDEFRGESGLEVHLTDTHYFIENVNEAA